jgi:hypothetical protein
MSRNPVLYKSLVVGVIVLFIGVGIQPAFAITDNGENIKAGNNENGDDLGTGFILCNVWLELYNPAYPEWSGAKYLYIPYTGIIITCKDLDTGKTRIGIAKLGLKLFKFLPLGHDFKLEFGINKWEERYIYNFDGFERVDLIIE